MIITYYGKAFVKLQFGDMTVAINPISKKVEGKSPRFGADIALSSLQVPEFSGTDLLVSSSKEPFIIDGPGEYELSDVFIKGYPSPGPDGRVNTIYMVQIEGMKICHLGGLAENNLADSILEEISGADVLFVPLGEQETVSAKLAAKLGSSLIPKIIIPVLYGEKETTGALIEFLKEIGGNKPKSIDKLSLKKKDLENKEGEVVVLMSS